VPVILLHAAGGAASARHQVGEVLALRALLLQLEESLKRPFANGLALRVTRLGTVAASRVKFGPPTKVLNPRGAAAAEFPSGGLVTTGLLSIRSAQGPQSRAWACVSGLQSVNVGNPVRS